MIRIEFQLDLQTIIRLFADKQEKHTSSSSSLVALPSLPDSSCFSTRILHVLSMIFKSNTISARFHRNSCAEDWLARLASVWALHSHSLAPHSSSRQTCISIFRIFDNHDFRKDPSFPVASGATGNAPRVRRGQGWTAGSISENHIFRYQVFNIFVRQPSFQLISTSRNPSSY